MRGAGRRSHILGNSVAIAAWLAAIGLCLWLLWLRDQEGSLQTIGIVEPTDIAIGSAVDGRVAELRVAVGDRVTAGQALGSLAQPGRESALHHLNDRLARLDEQASLIAQAASIERLRYDERLQEMRSEAADQRLRLLELEAELAGVEGELPAVTEELARRQELVEAGIQTGAGMGDPAARKASLEARQQALPTIIEALRRNVEQQDAWLEEHPPQATESALQAWQALQVSEIADERALVQQAINELDLNRQERLLTAPRDGRIVSISVHPGSPVTAGNTILVLRAADGMRIRGYLAESDGARLQEDLQIGIARSTDPAQRRSGHITAIGPRVLPATQITELSLPTSERYEPFTIDIDDAEGLRAGERVYLFFPEPTR